jgi:hypothetical protein
MTDGDDHRVLDAITAAIRTNTGNEGIVTAFALVAAFADGDGVTALYTETMPDQRCHETLGLLSFAVALENQRAIGGGDDDGD